MDNKAAYTNLDYRSQAMAMNANLSALESNLLNFTLWTYCPNNSHEWGDGWNGEDLSIFCMDDKTMSNKSAHLECINESKAINFEVVDPNSTETTINGSETSYSHESHSDAYLNAGGRVLDAIVRAYPMATPGLLVSLHFDIYEHYLYFSFEHSPLVSTQPSKTAKPSSRKNHAPPEEDLHNWCEIFLPRQHFPSNDQVSYCVADGLNSRSISTGGEWIVNTLLQRVWFKCSCHGGSGNSSNVGGSSLIHPTVRHTVIIKRGKQVEMNAFSSRLLRKGVQMAGVVKIV